MVDKQTAVALAIGLMLPSSPALAVATPARDAVTHPAPSRVAATTPAPDSTEGGSDVVRSSGFCSQRGAWSISARAARRGVRVTVNVRGAKPHRRWRIRAWQDGIRFASRTRWTNGRGAFAFSRRIANRPGVDTIAFAARSRTTGNACAGTLQY